MKTDLEMYAPIRDAFYEHCTFHYDNMGADYSATDLLKPPRIVQLEKRYRDHFNGMPLDHDAIMKAIPSFRGSAIHNHFEFMLKCHARRHPESGYIIEKRLWDRICDRKISAKFDLYKDKALYDFKTTSTWKAIFGDHDDWEKQLNIYAFMLRLCKIEVNVLYILAFYMDWDKWKVGKEKGYPNTPIERLLIKNLWPMDKQELFIHNRIELLKENEELPDHQLTLCTPEEMWEKPAKFAVYKVKEDNPDDLPQRASRVKDTEEGATKWMNSPHAKKQLKKGEIFTIQYRPGARMRCDEYCRCAPFCSQYLQYMEAAD